MNTLLDIVTQLNGRIEGGSEYGWDCFGPNARMLDFPNVGVIFDSETQEVYAVDAWPNNYDDTTRTILWVAPDYEVAYRTESTERGFYDEVDHCYSFQAIMEIAVAVMDKKPFDPGLANEIELFFDEGELEMLQQAAHLSGRSLDDYINHVLMTELDRQALVTTVEDLVKDQPKKKKKKKKAK